MRRTLGPILVVIGALLVGLGVLAKPYLYNRLATVPLDQETTSVSEGNGMSVLYPHVANGAAALDKLTGAKIKSTRTVIGIPGKVAEQGLQRDTAFWQTQVKSQAQVNGKWVDLSYSDEGVSFNRVTGEVANCCGDYRSTGDLDNPKKTEPAMREGLYFKFPFDTQKQAYAFWDGDLGKATQMDFKQEEDLYGTKTYVFETKIPKTKIASRDVPASLFTDGAEGNTKADVMYGNTRTLWVEPSTGVIVKGQEKQDKTLVSPLGTVAMTVGTIGYNESTIEENAKTWGSKGSLLGLIRGPLTWMLVIPGLLLAALGAWLILGGRREREAVVDHDVEDDPTLLDDIRDAGRRRRDV